MLASLEPRQAASGLAERHVQFDSILDEHTQLDVNQVKQGVAYSRSRVTLT